MSIDQLYKRKLRRVALGKLERGIDYESIFTDSGRSG